MFSRFYKIYPKRYYYKTKSITNPKKIKVAIYGANELGIQYLSSIRLSPLFEVICLIDDSKDLLGRSISDIPIKSSENIKNIVEKIDRLVLADIDLDRSKINYLAKILLSNSIKLYKLPLCLFWKMGIL